MATNNIDVRYHPQDVPPEDEAIHEAICDFHRRHGAVKLQAGLASYLVALAGMANSSETTLTLGDSTVVIKPGPSALKGV